MDTISGESNRKTQLLFLEPGPGGETRRFSNGRSTKGSATLSASISALIFCPTISGLVLADFKFYASLGMWAPV